MSTFLFFSWCDNFWTLWARGLKLCVGPYYGNLLQKWTYVRNFIELSPFPGFPFLSFHFLSSILFFPLSGQYQDARNRCGDQRRRATAARFQGHGLLARSTLKLLVTTRTGGSSSSVAMESTSSTPPWRWETSFGSAQEFVWSHDSSEYAIRENNSQVRPLLR